MVANCECGIDALTLLVPESREWNPISLVNCLKTTSIVGLGLEVLEGRGLDEVALGTNVGGEEILVTRGICLKLLFQ